MNEFPRAELLDKWWAPKPLTSRTKVMEFKVGGRRFYAMVSPEASQMVDIGNCADVTIPLGYAVD